MEKRRFLLWGFIGLFLVFVPHMSLAQSGTPEAPKTVPWLSVDQLAAAVLATSTPPQPARIDPSDPGATVALMGPAVFRIVFHWQGTSTLPNFDVDPKTNSWKLIERSTKPVELPYDIYALGSGFLVSSDGYALTNAHVVSETQFKREQADSIMYSLMLSILFSKDQRFATYYGDLTSAERTKLWDDGVDFIAQHLQMPTKPSIVALRPVAETATTTSISKLREQLYAEATQKVEKILSDGIPVEVAYVNNNYKEDERDFAVIKLAQSNTPALRLGNSDPIVTGNPVFNLGFPGGADTQVLGSVPSFTSGSVSARKDSSQHTFSLIQTDAKLADGSSGSPLFNDRAEVIGIVTKRSDNSQGDTFGFAIPITLMQNKLAELNISTSTSNDYLSLLGAGIASMEARRCKNAIASFETASALNSPFGAIAPLVQPYIDRCQALIAAGQSLDGWWDTTRNWVASRTPIFWAGVAAALAVAAGAGATVWLLLKRMRREEHMIEELEHQLEHPAPAQTSPVAAQPAPAVAAATAPAKPLAPQTPPAHPDLSAYIASARAQKQPDAQIAADLMKAGWNILDVNAALLKK